MTGDPTPTLEQTRDPRAEAAITGGLAAYNATRFRPSDIATLDVLVRDDSGEPVGGLLGHTSFGLFFLDCSTCPTACAAPGSAAASSAWPKTRRAAAAAPPLSSTPSRFRRPAFTSCTAIAALARSPARPTAPPGSF